MKNIARSLIAGAALTLSAIVTPGWAKGDDVDFARALVRAGYVDLATEYCRKLESDPKTSAEDKAGIQMIQAEIFAKAATQTDDAKLKQEQLDKAVETLRDFIKNNPVHPRSPEAKFTIGLLLRQKGDEMTSEMKKASGDAKKEFLNAGDKLYKEAASYFEGLIQEYRDIKDKFETANQGELNAAQQTEYDNILYALMDATYNVPRTQYAHCQIFDSGSKEKIEMAKKAVTGFMDFELDYQDRMKAYESAIFWALTHKELSEFSAAYQRFDFAVSLKEYFKDGPLPDDARDIIMTGYYYKAQTQNEEKKFAEAIQTVDEMAALLKEAAWKERLGIAALLLKGEALMGLGDKEKAEKLGQDLYKKAPTEGLKMLVRSKIASWSSGGGNIQAYLIRYEAALDRGDLFGAIRALQGGVAAAEASDQMEPVPDLLWKMAAIYEELQRTYDAVICYEAIAREHQKYAKADEAAFRAAQTWNRIASRIGGEQSWEKDQVTDNLKLLTGKWPNSSFSKNAQFLVADAAYEKGNFEEAAKQYEKVPVDATYYERAMVMAGKCFFDLARTDWSNGKKTDETKKKFDRSQAAFEKYFTYVKANPPKDERQERERSGVEAFAKQSLANLLMHEAKQLYAEAIKVLDEIDTPDASAEVQKRVWRQKVTAFLESGNVAKAIEYTDRLMSSHKASRETIEACQMVGRRCDLEAEKIAGENPTVDQITPEALKFWELAARYYANWIISTVDGKQKLDVQQALGVADRIYGLGLIINQIDEKKSFTSYDLSKLKNARIFNDAGRIYEPIAMDRHAGVDTSKLQLKMAWCFDFAQDWERARDSYEALLDAERVRNTGGTLNDTVLQAKPWLFVAYTELGHVYMRLAEKNINKMGSLQEAYTIFSNVVSKSEKSTEGWWHAKYLVIKILFDKGGQNDFEYALLGMKDMRANYPRWDENKFGMTEMWDALEKEILSKEPKKK
ncbi:MAG: tetratricopeptide repeat protein [Candidatus Brocadiae bacterium]|nr:tetratricopeptide repeat protein [Candidatus Brocadiia bacterium]